MNIKIAFFVMFSIMSSAFSPPSMAAAAMNLSESGACPENCPGCNAVLEARKRYVEREMAVQENTVLKEQLVDPFASCSEVLDLINLAFSIQFMSIDIVAILEGVINGLIDKVCNMILSMAKGYINGIINLFNEKTELPYGLGSVVTLSESDEWGTGTRPVNPGVPSPNIPRL